MIDKKDAITLASIVAGSVISYNVIKSLLKKFTADKGEWVPVGKVKELYIYPIKSCKGKKVFSISCDEMGAANLENRDRMFLVINSDAHFFTARTKPQLVLVDCDVADGKLHLKYDDEAVEVDLNQVYKRANVVKATLHENLRQDGYDCGDEAAEFFSKVVNEDARLVVFSPGLFTERTCITQKGWWRNPVPSRADDAYFVDLAQFLVTTQESLDEVNAKLGREEKPIQNVQFRANIVVENCSSPWHEDSWAEIAFGELPNKATILECFKPCTRCIFTTIDPETGVKDPDQQPLKKLKEYRMPEPDLIKDLGSHPIFGVNAGLKRPGFVIEGQTVWAKLKISPF